MSLKNEDASILLLWTWITGGLHLDGLADLSDALGASHRDPQRFFEVLRDPHLGSFGVIALVLMLLGKFVLLSLLPASTMTALLLIPAWARLGPLLWVWWLPSLHAGMGERFAWQQERAAIAVWSLLLLAPLLLFGWGLFLKRKLGGHCGDALGAGIEVCELGLLMSLITETAA